MAQRRNLKWRVNEAIMNSTLLPAQRLLMFVFSDLADANSGVIPEERKDATTIKELARRTGFDEATVKRHKPTLIGLGWLKFERPTWKQQSNHETGTYTIAVGRNPVAQDAPPVKPRKGRGKPDPVAHSAPPARPDQAPDSDNPMAQDAPPAGAHGTPAPGAQNAPSGRIEDDRPGAHSAPAGGAQCATPVAQDAPPIKEYQHQQEHQQRAFAADAAAPGADEGSKTTDRKRSGGSRKTAKPKQPDPVGDTAQELTVAFFERYRDENVQTFPAVRGVVKTALERGVPRDVLAHAMAGVMERGYAISGQSLTVELNRMRQVANGTGRNGMTTGQQRLADAADIADEMRRLDEAEATHQPPILFALPPGRTA